MNKENEVVAFPRLPENNWRSDWPYLITLSDGAQLAAYPTIGHVDENENFCFGSACSTEMWHVSDRIMEHPWIVQCANARIIQVEHVAAWQPLKPGSWPQSN